MVRAMESDLGCDVKMPITKASTATNLSIRKSALMPRRVSALPYFSDFGKQHVPLEAGFGKQFRLLHVG